MGMLKRISGQDLAIDLGTRSTQIYATGHGVVLSEPSLAAVDDEREQVVAAGWEAKRLLQDEPAGLEAVWPLKSGVVADFEVAEQMLSFFLRKVRRRVYGVYGRFLRPPVKPRVLLCVPPGATNLEISTACRVAIAAGARKAHTIEGPLAAAIGAGLPIDQSRGSMIVDVGGGKTEVAILSLGEIVAGVSVRIGGNDMDAAIRSYIRREHILSINLREAERLKIELGSALPLEEDELAKVGGADLFSGDSKDSKTILVRSSETHEAIKGCLKAIAEAVRVTFESTSAELVSDIAEGGVVLCGSGAQLRFLEDLLRYQIGVPVYIAKEPHKCAAMGAGWVLEHG